MKDQFDPRQLNLISALDEWPSSRIGRSSPEKPRCALDMGPDGPHIRSGHTVKKNL